MTKKRQFKRIEGMAQFPNYPGKATLKFLAFDGKKIEYPVFVKEISSPDLYGDMTMTIKVKGVK